uniref:Myb/SANT-like DNA-binding domain-containing protein n=1 Tax=Oryzias latipes TaxID=8090 RepID=A0A3P9IYZ1_ORYLA
IDAAETSQWKGSEVTDLINIWGDSSIQAKLEGSYRNRARGYRRSWLQCQRKIKSLRAKYKEVKDWNKRSGRQHITCPFYKELDRILGDKPSVADIRVEDQCCRWCVSSVGLCLWSACSTHLGVF